jgi:hypothetical protein
MNGRKKINFWVKKGNFWVKKEPGLYIEDHYKGGDRPYTVTISSWSLYRVVSILRVHPIIFITTLAGTDQMRSIYRAGLYIGCTLY